ncbi:protein of unknown function [Reichenbachiella faecimaris]|uniref:PKD domain-containing protein n=1 Tax=Reichenbachiella faecimaris TaxID=692418 RepID=A0A1W2G8F8_REIFA|nr:DUF4331 family protein [Reichenbachiella faecimaris]SMD32891.1 protein of unknown function [Reichenbachiella faecimaris]
MKNIRVILAVLLVGVMGFTACDEDDDPESPMLSTSGDVTVDIEKTVTLEVGASSGTNLTYAWILTDPDGTVADLSDATSATPSFVASIAGTYSADVVVVSSDGGTANETIEITVVNPTYEQEDQMGRPAINTVFNYFGDADTKNAYNQTLPANGSSNAGGFEGILDALQNYIGLDADTYANVLGLDNTTTATVLSTDVLNCNKSASTTYGPSDLDNITLFSNVLNGRGLDNDVVDVTLILAFAGDDLTNLSSLQEGLIADGVAANDKSFSTEFPYLASPH